MKANGKKTKYDMISDKKVSTPTEVLCKGIPNEFVKYLDYCKKLKFEEKPDYMFLKNIFKTLFIHMNFELDYKYDWTKVP